MQITKACEQYFNAYQELGNWKNNDKWTNTGLVLEVVSYFTLVAPLIVLAAYAAASLAGRVAQIFQPSSSDVKTSEVFQKLHNNQTISISEMSLKELSELDSKGQQEVMEELCKLQDCKDYSEKKIIGECLGNGPINLLSEEQRKHYFGNLKAADMNQDLYDHLFVYDNLLGSDDDHTKVYEERFHLIPKEEVAEIMKKFAGEPKDLLSEEQMKYYFCNLKANEITLTLYNNLFAYEDDREVHKTRFQLIAKEEVSSIMEKLCGRPRDLLSKEQMNYYFGNLKADNMNETLYNALFIYCSPATIEERFKLLSDEQKLAFQNKFGNR